MKPSTRCIIVKCQVTLNFSRWCMLNTLVYLQYTVIPFYFGWLSTSLFFTRTNSFTVQSIKVLFIRFTSINSSTKQLDFRNNKLAMISLKHAARKTTSSESFMNTLYETCEMTTLLWPLL